MILFLVDANVILAELFRNKTREELSSTRRHLKKELDKRGFLTHLHTLDNESPEMHKDDIEASDSKHQMAPTNSHTRNASERTARTFKKCFLRGLAGLDEKFPMSMWGHLIPQAVITLNLLRKVIFILNYLHGPTIMTSLITILHQ